MSASGKSFWKDHVLAWKESGLTQKVYCEQAKISFQSFVYQNNRMNSKSKTSSINFIEAKTELPIENQKAGLQLMFPNGIRIGVGCELNDRLLERILTIAGGMKC
jgi:hypothetical protein